MFTFNFSISDVNFKLLHDTTIKITDSFKPFSTDEMPYHWSISYNKVSSVPDLIGKVIFSSFDYEIISNGEELIILYKERDTEKLYAINRIDYSGKKVEICFLTDYGKYFSETNNCLFHSRWERILLENNRLILHSSCIDTEYGGILFTGPSGIGKSTQSDLWIKKEKASLLNGDRPIIGKVNGIWNAFGSPYAGSSRCYINKQIPIRCIVILEQGSENRIKRLSMREATVEIYRNLTIYPWDKEFVSRAFDLANDLVCDVPVYRFSCIPDNSSVSCLKKELELDK